MCLMVIKYTISITIRGSMPDKDSAKSFPAEVADRFIKSDKIEANMHLSKLINMRYNGKENIREYIMKMFNLVFKLKTLKLELSEEIQVHFILISFLIKNNFIFSRLFIMLKEKSGVSLSSSVTVSGKKRD